MLKNSRDSVFVCNISYLRHNDTQIKFFRTAGPVMGIGRPSSFTSVFLLSDSYPWQPFHRYVIGCRFFFSRSWLPSKGMPWHLSCIVLLSHTLFLPYTENTLVCYLIHTILFLTLCEMSEINFSILLWASCKLFVTCPMRII